MPLPDEVKKYLEEENIQHSYGIKLSAIGVDIAKAKEELKKLERRRNDIIVRLSKAGMSISRLAGISGLHRNKISEIIDFATYRKEVDPDYMEEPPDWFGKSS